MGVDAACNYYTFADAIAQLSTGTGTKTTMMSLYPVGTTITCGNTDGAPTTTDYHHTGEFTVLMHHKRGTAGNTDVSWLMSVVRMDMTGQQATSKNAYSSSTVTASVQTSHAGMDTG